MDPLAYRLLNDWQRDFPLRPSPFREVGLVMAVTEETVIEAYRGLLADGTLSRIGAVFRPNTVGASALAALAAPAERLAEVAALVSAQPEVNHNYEREHRWNLWFVVTAADKAGVAAALDRIESLCGLVALRLPLEEEFHIDLGFDLANGSVPRGEPPPVERVTLSEREARLVAALEHGLPLVSRPFEELGRMAGFSERQVMATLSGWIGRGVVRRFGTVVRHRSLGYRANAMVVWDVPDGEAGAAGRRLAALPEVTLCYRRARQLPDWPYNLFCMIHGKERAAVARAIEDATQAAGLDGRRREVLFSGACFAQKGARYAHG
jgi:DNA-binding Lrp family transcriptional regulator